MKTIKTLPEAVAKIAELDCELNATKNDLERSYGRRKEAEEKYETEKERVSDALKNLDRGRETIETMARQLFEIVRWHVNPETARYPYQGFLKENEKVITDSSRPQTRGLIW